jgi:uncharacterized protein
MTGEAIDYQVSVNSRIGEVSALLLRPSDAWLLYVVAHGAGAGMRHPFLERTSAALAAQGIATFRYQFPYMEKGRGRPDPPQILEETVQAAVNRAGEIAPDLPVVAGGKSLGGRMTSSAASAAPLPRVRGLVFLGFPLHPPGQPGTHRADHLHSVDLPMLFLQGTRDGFAQLDLITGVVARLGPRATLHLVDGADHSFGVQKRSGRTPVQVQEELVNGIARWARPLIPSAVRA